MRSLYDCNLLNLLSTSELSLNDETIFDLRNEINLLKLKMREQELSVKHAQVTCKNWQNDYANLMLRNQELEEDLTDAHKIMYSQKYMIYDLQLDYNCAIDQRNELQKKLGKL